MVCTKLDVEEHVETQEDIKSKTGWEIIILFVVGLIILYLFLRK